MSCNGIEYQANALEGRCAFVRALSDERLNWLISALPLGTDLLEHAAHCEECGRRIEALGDREFATLPPLEQGLLDNWAAEFVARNFCREKPRSVNESPAPGLVSTMPFAPNASRLWKLVDERRAPAPWEVNRLGFMTRMISLSPNSFRQVGALGAVLGKQTVEYEVDLSPALEGFESLDIFSALKLIIRTGRQTSAAALLQLKSPQTDWGTRPLQLEVDLFGKSGRPLNAHTIALRVGDQTKSGFVKLHTGAQATQSFTEARITFRELPYSHVDADDN